LAANKPQAHCELISGLNAHQKILDGALLVYAALNNFNQLTAGERLSKRHL
jgi:hypothetical protein